MRLFTEAECFENWETINSYRKWHDPSKNVEGVMFEINGAFNHETPKWRTIYADWVPILTVTDYGLCITCIEHYSGLWEPISGILKRYVQLKEDALKASADKLREKLRGITECPS